MDSNVSRHIVAVDASVRDAMALINALSGDAMTLFAVDSDMRVAGTVTDGDVRRALIAGADLDSPVDRVMNRSFISVAPDTDAAPVIAKARSRGIDLLPVVEEGRLLRLYDLRRLRTVLPIDAVLMAGGRGERLRPLTLDTPKPLLKVGGRPIIDYNVEALRACGVDNIFVTVNYLHGQIEEHFSHDSDVSCVLEPCRLGTIGSLSLIRDWKHDNVLLMNSDLLTSVDFESMLSHHVAHGADMTVATVPYTVSVPFAILATDDDRVSALVEKPTYNYLANAGIYMLRRSIVDDIPEGEPLDAPTFMEQVIARGGKVSHFPVNGSWIDIGSPDDFRFANEVMRNSSFSVL